MPPAGGRHEQFHAPRSLTAIGVLSGVGRGAAEGRHVLLSAPAALAEPFRWSLLSAIAGELNSNMYNSPLRIAPE